MENKRFLNAKDVAEYMEISESMAYKIIRQLNDELKKAGYITIAGKVSRIYFLERTYGGDTEKEEDSRSYAFR